MTEQRYIRPIKARCLERVVRGYEDRTGGLQVRYFGSCTVEGRGQVPGISASVPDNYIVDDVDYCARVVDVPKATGRVLYGGYLRHQWGHFLLNSTARLWPLFTGAVDDVERIVFFSDGADCTISGNMARFFELAGIADKVEVAASGHFSAAEVIVPDIALEHPVFFSREFMAPFDAVRRAVSGGVQTARTHRVFLTRSALPGASKNEVGIGDVDRFFAANGYEVISPERLSLDELIKTLSEARTVASVSGSLAHNFVFADRATEFVVVERTAVVNDYQVGLGLAMGIEQTYVDAFRLPWPARATGSVFLYGDTECLRRFAAGQGMTPPTFGLDPGDEVQRFARRCRREYGYDMSLREYEIDVAEAVAEAVAESAAYYRPWLDGRHALFLSDYFSLRFWLRRAKRLLDR